ncbi:MAG: alcohol dehydrogenase catalytic domain-containing protein [Candidatus Stahlbacteria bacterium]|nr:alcohol dehydrogenase catalytic domain-containing protein [Candidatus Stahlbacteria bacterium]
MKVAMYYSNKDLRIEEMPIPKIGADELLVKVMASGICGSDVMEWYRKKKAPNVLGHEIAGEIVEVGQIFRSAYKKGDRVFVSHHVPCNECSYCKKGYHTLCDTLRTTNFEPGGFAEYIRIPKINIEKGGVYLLPQEMTFEEATFIEPLACVIRGQQLIKVQKGDTVLVLGSGISGLLHIQLAKVYGAEKIIATDINDYRLKAAEKLGADVIIRDNSQSPTPNLQPPITANRIIICTSALRAFKQAFYSVERAGTILFFAPTEPGIEIPLPLFELWNKQVTLISTYAAVSQDINESIELIRTHKIKVNEMITHRLKLEETGLGFQIVEQARNSIKVIIEPHTLCDYSPRK